MATEKPHDRLLPHGTLKELEPIGSPLSTKSWAALRSYAYAQPYPHATFACNDPMAIVRPSSLMATLRVCMSRAMAGEG